MGSTVAHLALTACSCWFQQSLHDAALSPAPPAVLPRLLTSRAPRRAQRPALRARRGSAVRPPACRCCHLVTTGLLATGTLAVSFLLMELSNPEYVVPSESRACTSEGRQNTKTGHHRMLFCPFTLSQVFMSSVSLRTSKPWKWILAWGHPEQHLSVDSCLAKTLQGEDSLQSSAHGLGQLVSCSTQLLWLSGWSALWRTGSSLPTASRRSPTKTGADRDSRSLN